MVYQLVSNGDVPDEDYFNGALMKQTVIVCTSGTRPSSPVAGMTIFETDTKMERRYTGSAWKASGVLPYVLLHKTTASISNNSVTTINWSSEGRDLWNMWSSGSASLITVPYDGDYEVFLSVRFASQGTVSGYRQCRIDVGGAEQNVMNLAPTTALNSTNVVVNLFHPMTLTAGEQIECKVYQNSGGALDIISPTRVLVKMVSEGAV